MAKEKRRKFFKTVVQVTILSEDKPVGPNMELDQIHYAITDGDCSGDCKVVSQKQVSGKKMAMLLTEQGSDPGFFNLDENGKKLEE